MTNLNFKFNPESDNTRVFMGDNESPAEVIESIQKLASLISPETAAKLVNDQELLGRAMSAIRAAGLTIPQVLIEEKSAIEALHEKREQAFNYLSSYKSEIQNLLDQINAHPAKKAQSKVSPLAPKKMARATSVENSSETPAASNKESTKAPKQGQASSPVVAKSSSTESKPESAKSARVTARSVIRQALIDAIATLGGKASKRDVLDIMETKLEPVLTPDDKKQYRPGRNEKAWQATAGWVISDLKREGLARTDVKPGIWALV